MINNSLNANKIRDLIIDHNNKAFNYELKYKVATIVHRSAVMNRVESGMAGCRLTDI